MKQNNGYVVERLSYNAVLFDGCPITEPILPPNNLQRIPVGEFYHVADDAALQLLKRRLPPIAADLLELGIGAFLFDACSSRSTKITNQKRRLESWGQRDMHLIMPVRNLDVWQQPQVYQKLAEALVFVTGDSSWNVEFVRYEGAQRSSEKHVYFPHDVSRRVCLMSEGVDSACGLASQLTATQDERFLAVSAFIQTQTMPLLQGTIGLLHSHFHNRLEHLPVRMHFKRDAAPPRREIFQRTRSFLLLILGAAMAIAAGSNEVEIYENGLECFNLPIHFGALPAQESRTMHPIFLYRMSQFVSALIGKPFRFAAPNLLRTKAEMVEKLTLPFKEKLLQNTVSCMHFPLRLPGQKGRQCGSCNGCILRQMAFAIGNIREPLGDYWNAKAEERAREIRLLRGQIDSLHHAFQTEEEWEVLLRHSGVEVELWDEEFAAAVSDVSGLSTDNVKAAVPALYKRHIQEWRTAEARMLSVS